MTVNIHRIDPDNIGDQACSPLRYFRDLRFKIRPVDIQLGIPNADAYLVGGGGLMHGKWMDTLSQVAARGKPCVAWGIGMNTHDTEHFIWPKFLDSFAAVGLRDYGNPWDYVPCPSCLHPAFNVPHASRHPFVIYEHHAAPIPLSVPAPRLQNRQPFSYFDNVIRFLSSGRVVVTNTFHGAYWSMLLGRPTVIFRPYSNRFRCFKEVPAFADTDTWSQAIVDATPPSRGYLLECRDLNHIFKDLITPILT